MLIDKNKAYLSDQESTGLWIFNPETMQKTGFVETGNTTEKMVRVGNEVIVTNWSNYYQPGTSNSTIQFVDIATDKLVDEMDVTAEPHSIVLDKNNNIWVLCSGGYMPPCEPALFCINPKTREIVKRFDFAEGDYPSSMAIDKAGENLYILNGGFGTLDLYKMSVDDETLPTTPFVDSQQPTANSQSMVFSTVTVSEDGDIYLTDVKNYVQNGDVLRYDSNGNFVTKFEAGIVPGAMMFN
jgi:DNA-binding beta-propeller fold protein YncE